MLKELTTEEFASEVLQSEGKSVVMYSQTTCMPCKVVEAQLASINLEDGNIVKVNLTNTPELNDPTFLGDPVMSTPSLFVFESGKLTKEYRGKGLSMSLVAELMS